MASGDRASADVEQQLRHACEELSQRLRGGEPILAESVLGKFPALAAHAESAQELVYTEFVVREELGESPAPAEWYSRFPQWRDDLERLFQVHQFIRQAEHESHSRLATPSAQAHLPTVGQNWYSGANEESSGDGSTPVQRQVSRIGNYELLHEIGRGGMGVVYKARQVGLNRIVALKMLLAGDFATRDELTRFRHEAEAAARLQHPNIVRVYEVGSHGDFPYFSLEYVAGGNLQKQMAEGRLAPRAAAQLVALLARAAHCAHELGIVHRDLKPSNVLLQKDASGEQEALGFCPKIADFGLAKYVLQAAGATHTGAMLGTPSYMAPEQASGDARHTDRRTDVWALGAMLYEMLTGRRPFQAISPLATLEQIRSREPIRPKHLEPGLPRELETICLKCLEKEPRRRYDSAADLAADLQRYLAGEPILASPAGWWVRTRKWARRRPALAALMVTVVLGFVGVTWQWRRAELNRAQATLAAQAAQQATLAERAERDRVERSLYTRKVALSHRAYVTHDTAGALQLLESTPPELRHWEWHFLNRFCRSEILRLEGHSMPVRTIAVSPDGQWIASASAEWGYVRPGEIIVWNAESGAKRWTLRGHPSSIMCVAFSPDSQRLVSAGVYWHREEAGEVRLWDLRDGQAVVVLPEIDASSAQFSPDGSQLALGHSDGRISFHDGLTGALQFQPLVARPARDVFEVVYHPDGTKLASAHHDGSVFLWDARDGRELARIAGLGSARRLAFRPDGRRLAVGTFQGFVKIFAYDTEGFREVASHSRTTSISRLAYSPNGRLLAVVTTGEGVELWDAATGEIENVFYGHQYDAAFSPHGRRLVTGGRDRVVRVWDLTADPFPRSFVGLGSIDWVSSLDLSPDGRYLAVAAGENRAVGPRRDPSQPAIWDLSTRSVVATLAGHGTWLTDVQFSPQGQELATSGEDHTVRIWHWATGEQLHRLSGHSSTVQRIAYSPDGHHLVSAGHDGGLHLWDVRTGQKLRSFSSSGPPVLHVAFHPSGRHLVSAGSAGPVRIWEVASGKAAGSCRELSSRVTDLAITAQGDILATSDDDGRIQLWPLTPLLGGERTQPIAELQGHTAQVVSIGFSHDGRRLASASLDSSVKLWDVASGFELMSLKAVAGNNSRVRFGPDGRRLVVSHSIYVRQWDVGPAEPATLETAVRDASLRALTWHSDNARLCAEAGNWPGMQVELAQCLDVMADWPATDDVNLPAATAIQLARHLNRIAWRSVSGPPETHDAPTAPVWVERSLALAPDSRYTQNTLGAVYYRLKRFEDAAAALERAMKLGQVPLAEDHFLLAMTRYQLGDVQQAEAQYSQALDWCRSRSLSGRRWSELLLMRAEAEALLGAHSAARGLTIEAELLAARGYATEGPLARQSMQAWGDEWGGGQQLFWQPTRAPARLALTIDAPRDGMYELVAAVTQAPDYGQLQAYVNGARLGDTVDGFHPHVQRAEVVLGPVSLPAGASVLEFELLGKHAESLGYYAGLDAIRLVPVVP